MLISEGKVVDSSPAADGCKAMRMQSHVIMPCLPKNLYGVMEKNLVVIVIRDSGKSRSLAQNVPTDSYSPRKIREP